MKTLQIFLERSRRDKSNDIKKDHQRWSEWLTRAVQMCRSSFAFKRLVWHTLFTVDNIPWCHWIHLLEIFPTISVMSLLELWCASKIIFKIFVLSLPFFTKAKRKKRLWRHTKAPIISTRQIKWRKGRSPTVTEVCNMSHPKANEPWHIWTARVTHYGHCYWPFLVLLDSSLHIFPTVPVVSSSKFRYVSEVFSLSLLSSLFLL